MQKLPPAHAPAEQFCGNCAIAVIPVQWTPGLVNLLSLEGCFSSCERNNFVKLSGLEGLVSYFQLVKIISWKCKHKKNPLNSLLRRVGALYSVSSWIRTLHGHLRAVKVAMMF